MTYNEYKVEFRVFRRDGNEYQMRKIPLKEDSDEEARQVLIEMGYIHEDDKINIINIISSSEYSYNNSSDNNYPSESLFFTIGDFFLGSTARALATTFFSFILLVIGYNIFFGENSNVSSIEDGRSYLNGKTFIATPRGGLWYKLSFTESSCKLLSGVPHYVGWNESYNGSYMIKEGRYNDTGKKYFYVIFDKGQGSDDYLSLDCRMFDINRKSLYVCGNGNDPLAIMEIGDRDPWN